MAAVTPEDYLGIPVETLRVHAGYAPDDATHDAEIDIAYGIALESVESYLDRILTSGDYIESFTHVAASALSLKAYPLQEVVSVVVDPGASEPPFHKEDVTGLIKLDGHFAMHVVTVTYAGGYVKAPGPIMLALLATFDAVWASMQSASATVGKEVKATVVDGMRVEYFDPSAGSSSSAQSFGVVPSSSAQMLDVYRRQSA